MILLHNSWGSCAGSPVPERTRGAGNFCSIISNHSILMARFWAAYMRICFHLAFSQSYHIYIPLKQGAEL